MKFEKGKKYKCVKNTSGAFNSGAQEMDDWYSNPRGGTKSSEQYFNQTFTTNDD